MSLVLSYLGSTLLFLFVLKKKKAGGGGGGAWPDVRTRYTWFFWVTDVN